jgi:hypothetical protein
MRRHSMSSLICRVARFVRLKIDDPNAISSEADGILCGSRQELHHLERWEKARTPTSPEILHPHKVTALAVQLGVEDPAFVRRH